MLKNIVESRNKQYTTSALRNSAERKDLIWKMQLIQLGRMMYSTSSKCPKMKRPPGSGRKNASSTMLCQGGGKEARMWASCPSSLCVWESQAARRQFLWSWLRRDSHWHVCCNSGCTATKGGLENLCMLKEKWWTVTSMFVLVELQLWLRRECGLVNEGHKYLGLNRFWGHCSASICQWCCLGEEEDCICLACGGIEQAAKLLWGD